MIEHIDCWHFAGPTLRDGTPHHAVGTTLPEIADPVPCHRGYHGSVHALDALFCAPGPWVARVRLHGVVLPSGDPVDQYVGSLRTQSTAYVDVSDVLHAFARACALDVVHLWDAPEIVVYYLRTGDPAAKVDAWVAARDARATVWTVPRAATWHAAMTAINCDACDSARVAASITAWAGASDAASATAWADARSAQNTRLEQMLMEAMR